MVVDNCSDNRRVCLGSWRRGVDDDEDERTRWSGTSWRRTSVSCLERSAIGIDLVVDGVDEMIVRIDQKNDWNMRRCRWREWRKEFLSSFSRQIIYSMAIQKRQERKEIDVNPLLPLAVPSVDPVCRAFSSWSFGISFPTLDTDDGRNVFREENTGFVLMNTRFLEHIVLKCVLQQLGGWSDHFSVQVVGSSSRCFSCCLSRSFCIDRVLLQRHFYVTNHWTLIILRSVLATNKPSMTKSKTIFRTSLSNSAFNLTRRLIFLEK